MFRRRRKTDVDAKDKQEPGATWKEFEREKKSTTPVKLLRLGLPLVLGGIAGGFRYSGAFAAWGFLMGAVIGGTIILIVRQIDVEKTSVALAASVVGAVSGAPAAVLLWFALLGGFAPETFHGVVTGGAVFMALIAGLFGWIVGTLAGGFAAVVIWGFMEFFG
ncbi:MAG TPA: hypothetical protein VI893_00960 [Thermoplasmata archaeon]|nr:hypothetical protein [Thermoplasmata archaeon]